MDPSTANFRPGLREQARRLGLPDFWRWWTANLRTLIPRAPRNALQRRRLRPVLVFQREAAVVWKPQTTASGVSYVEAARIPLQGDATQTMQAGRAAMEMLPQSRGSGGGPRVIVALTSGQVLRKWLTYPAAVQENLDHVLGYDLDRHTPFKADELYFDAGIVGRDTARSEVRVELVAALKTLVDQLRRQAAAWGALVVAVSPEEPRAGAAAASVAKLNLLPEESRLERSAWRRWGTWVPVSLIGALALAAMAIPLLQKREMAIDLLRTSEQARVQAAASDALRQQLERSVDDYNFVLARKYAFPSALQLLDDVTRLLPDDTWLTVLEMKSVPKGKEPHREIVLKGETGNAGRLISLLEDSNLVEQAAPRSPTTKIQPGPGEIFDLGAQLKALQPPPPVALAYAGSVLPEVAPVASTTPAPAGAGAGGAPVAEARTAPVAEARTPPGASLAASPAGVAAATSASGRPADGRVPGGGR